MVEPLLEVVVAPALVGASTLAARRWGQEIGGLVSAFPAIVGPVLLIGALEHGPEFASRAAVGTLLGLVALSGFALAYARAAARASWVLSLAAGWVVAAGIALAVGSLAAGPLAGLAAAALSLALAYRALPRRASPAAPPVVPRFDLPLRMSLTALLVVSLAAAGTAFGPLAAGILAALPVLASVLAVFTHEQCGGAAVADLMRGMLGGMAGFALFCAVIALLVDRAGIAPAFAAASVAALAAQVLAAGAGHLRLTGAHAH